MKERIKKIVAKANEHRIEIALTASTLVSAGLVIYYRNQLAEYKHRVPLYMTLDGVRSMEEGRMTKATFSTKFYDATITKKD